MTSKMGRKILISMRLRTDQLEYLNRVQNRQEWIREAIDEKRNREEKEKYISRAATK